MFEFAYPWALLLFLLIPLWYWYDRHKKNPVITVASIRPFRAAGRRRFNWVRLFYGLGLCLLILALARPRFGDEKVVIRARGIDIILALDLSGSMAAIDVPKDITEARKLMDKINSGELNNRLKVACIELEKFVKGRPNDRIGLIGFGPMAYSFVPPTLDHGWLTGQLDRLKPGIIGDMTGIAAPLASGIHRLKNSEAPRRVIVLFTDGQNNVDNTITPQATAELGKAENVIIHTVGIGSNNAYVPVTQFGRTAFHPVADGFDEAMLKAIAANSGGQYFHAANAEGMHRVMEDINRLETTSFEQPKYVEYRENAPVIALAALALLFLGFFLEHTWKLRVP